jgi:transposase
MADASYSSDLKDEEWSLIAPLLPPPLPDSPAGLDLRLVINSIFFLLRLGPPLRTAPPWSTAEAYYQQWQADGTWDKITAVLQATWFGPTPPPKLHPPPGG